MPSPTVALALLAAPSRLRPFDLALVAIYLIGITLFGLRFRKKTTSTSTAPDRSLRSYFLANNTIPWWAISLSIVSAETSTLTIISIPGVAFTGDFGFLQIVLGYMIGRVVVALLFLPRYFAGEMLTAYQLIDRRFGSSLHKVTAGLFLLTRAAAEGVRVFAVSIVVGIAIGTGNVLSIAIISALTLLYTFEGGLAAVIWTDVVQMIIYIGGTVVAIATLGSHIPGGWATIHTVAAAAGKFHMLNFALNLTTTYTFWAGVLGGTFLTMASHGTDQLMVQRMLAARNLRQSQLALLSSGVVIFIQFALFLLIGAGLYVFYGGHITGGPFIALSHRAMGGIAQNGVAHLPPGTTPDRLFPTFIVREMPLGLAGLLVAAILAAAMSNLSAALNSLSSATVVDFYMNLRPSADARERNLISKSSTVLWALVLFAIAVYSIKAGGKGHVVEIGLSIASVAYGCLLGVFLLGTLTSRLSKYGATQTGATIGMVCGFVLNLWLWQGDFPVHLGPITIPHIAWTWYVLIGAAATFLLGSLASLVFRKPSRHIATALLAAGVLILPRHSPAQTSVISNGAQRSGETPVFRPQPLDSVFLSGAHSAQSKDPESADTKQAAQPLSTTSSAAPDFSAISILLNDAVATHRPPGAVVLIGHNGHIVFEHAYGDRKLAGEPGAADPDDQPSPAEPMTEDTLFDMASLSKCLSTATAIMQLYEQGKIASFDSPVEKYLPAFNSQHDPERAKVTLRMLLTHTSGEAPDVSLKSPWGLAAPDKAEGIHLALTTPLRAEPGTHFEYSDVNFILLGYLVEKLSGEPLDVYAQDHIFKPLGMANTRYLPLAKACGPHQVNGSAIARAPSTSGRIAYACPTGDWSTALLPRIAPTAHDDEGTAATNPDFDRLLRGTVDDPTTRRMGGVAGHAGVFSTAHDISLFASALLEKLLYNTGPFPLKQSTLRLMATPEQPGHNPGQIPAAHAAIVAAISAGDKPAAPGLDPHYPAIAGQDLRGFGWDIDTAFSKPRGMIFPPSGPGALASFGHTGYTGTSLWMDPGSDTYVILLANSIHPRGNPPISNLRGQVATAAAEALGLYSTSNVSSRPERSAVERPAGSGSGAGTASMARHPERSAAQSKDPEEADSTTIAQTSSTTEAQTLTLTGIDVLESTHFSLLKAAALRHNHHLDLGLLTNQTGLDSEGRRTIDILHSLTADNIHLTTLFSPEHGIFGKQDSTHINADTDPTTGLPVTSLYGPTDADKRPSHDQLKDLDAVIIDLQDVGVRFYTFETVTGYFLEAAARELTQYHHNLEIIVLDRPDPIDGDQVQGPVSDPGLTTGPAAYIDFTPLPIRHGLTLGELAEYDNGTRHLNANLTVIPMQHWSRSEYFDQTGLPWTDPSPNLRNLTATTLYPGLGLLDFTNLSVGRGTTTPFELFGAGIPAPSQKSVILSEGAASHPAPQPKNPEETQPATAAQATSTSEPSQHSWFHAAEVAAALTARHIPGVTFAATTTTVAEDANHYPYHGQTIEAVRITLTDRTLLNSPELGIEILSALHRLYPTQFKLERSLRLIGSRSTLDDLERGDDPRSIAASWTSGLDAFKAARANYLLYP